MRAGHFTLSGLSAWKGICAVLWFVAATAIGSSAQIFTTLLDFDGTAGTNPTAPLVQGPDGNLYGTTPYGGAFSNCPNTSCGTIFRITPQGVLTTLHNFCAQSGCPDGYGPVGTVTLGSDGNFYGATPGGGNSTCGSGNGCGTIYKITPGGKFTTLHSFNGSDGSGPETLVQGAGGIFYGITAGGGTHNLGTFFQITAAGALTTLFNFDQPGPGNAYGLTFARDGNFYGATWIGGSDNCGSAFELTPAGVFTTLVNFIPSACRPASGLIQATDGNFYGTTFPSTGSNKGTVFQMTPTGSVTVIYNFCPRFVGCADGKSPNALIQATDGNLYGTAGGGGNNCASGGGNGCGTIFKLTTTGTLTTLHRFSGTDGAVPSAALVQSTNGTLYGTTPSGGSTSNYGTIFSESVGLGAFVETNPSAGKVGSRVAILGNNLAGTSSVSFNGQPAAFRIVSATAIVAAVPAGATTGNIVVTTASGTLTSNVVFVVNP